MMKEINIKNINYMLSTQKELLACLDNKLVELSPESIGKFLTKNKIARAHSKFNEQLYFINLDRLCYIDQNGCLVFADNKNLAEIDHEASEIPEQYYIRDDADFEEPNFSGQELFENFIELKK